VLNRNRLIGISAIAAIAVLGAINYHSSVAFRARHYFLIPWTQRVTPDSIRKGVTAVLPLGTPADHVSALLHSAGVGADGLSGYYILPGGTDSVIRLEYDPRHVTLVQEHYGIMLHFDDGLLSRVRVEQWFTGL
jgi:hypothetical protein